MERAIRQFEAGGSPAVPEGAASAGPGFVPGTNRATRPAIAPLTELARHGAERAVNPLGHAARRAAVERILQGRPAVSEARQGSFAEPALSKGEMQVEAVLARLGAAHPGENPSARGRAFASRLETGGRLPALPTRQDQDHPPAPRNGLERLLAQARRRNLIAEDQSEGGQARLSTEDGQVPDLGKSQRSGRAPAAVLDADQLAQAVTDLLRREARSAGIDLKGGRS